MLQEGFDQQKLGLMFPDQFAGVLPMCGSPRYFTAERDRYLSNAQYLPFYLVEGDRNGSGRGRPEIDAAAHGDERADKNDQRSHYDKEPAGQHDCAGWIKACELLPQIEHYYKYFRPPAL